MKRPEVVLYSTMSPALLAMKRSPWLLKASPVGPLSRGEVIVVVAPPGVIMAISLSVLSETYRSCAAAMPPAKIVATPETTVRSKWFFFIEGIRVALKAGNCVY